MLETLLIKIFFQPLFDNVLYSKSVDCKVVLVRLTLRLFSHLPLLNLCPHLNPFVSFLPCSKGIRGHGPVWSQGTAHHHHQTGSRASNLHWLVPGLGSQDVGDGSIGPNPCPFPSIKPNAFSTSLTPRLSCIC